MADVQNLIAIGRNPVPSGVTVGKIAADDGTELRAAFWGPTRDPLRGTVCLLPGRNEPIEKYFETVADVRRRGFAVAVLDWRGQGGSQRAIANPWKGHVEDFAQYDSDLNAFVDQVVLPNCPPPYHVLAHSMGGHIAIRNATAERPVFRSIIVTAPMLALHPDVLGYSPTLVASYAEAAVQLGFGENYAAGHNDDTGRFRDFEDNPLTSDAERFARNQLIAEVAPELMIGGPTVAWLAAALRSMRQVTRPAFAARIKVPILVVVAGQDRVVDPVAEEMFAERVKSCGLVSLPLARHEVLQEADPIRTRFWAAFDAYLGIDVAVA